MFTVTVRPGVVARLLLRVDRDEDVDRLVRRGGADLQATRRERHGESSYAHVLLAFLFLTDAITTTARLSSAS